jgi:nitrite reductase (NADH) small subunit
MSEHVIGSIHEIPVGEGRAYALNGAQIAVYRLRDGSVRALDAVCPHKGGPLADGLTDARVVVCPLHGHTYDLTTGTELTIGADSVRSYHACVNDDGTIRIALD